VKGDYIKIKFNIANVIVTNGFAIKCYFFDFIKFDFNLNFISLMDLYCVDLFSSICRFELNYIFFSLINSFSRLCIINKLKSFEYISLSNVFYSSSWLEREIYDLFGIWFYKNKNLRRILNDYTFNGFPLRKDFPLIGYKQIKYDENLKKIVSQKITYNQELRNFYFNILFLFFGNVIVLNV